MKYLLDTNTCIRYINGRSLQLRAKFLTLAVEDIAVCSIVKAELYAGSAKSVTPERSLTKQQSFISQFISLPFDDAAATVDGQVRASLEKTGMPIGPLDMLIAAIAIAHNPILVTHNTTEFSRIPNLRLEDWES
jgi:tRNA(fMet)-specific endonuclease VapC